MRCPHRRPPLSLALALLLQAAAPAAEPVPEDIVVTARSNKCDVSIANRVLSDAEFRRRIDEWRAGTPVRVRAPAAADYKCLAKIAFRLSDKGVKKIIFVE